MWAVIVLLALLGLLGPGPLSHTTVRSKSGTLSAEFDRYDRASRESEMQIEVEVDPSTVATAGGRREIGLWIGRDFMEQLRITRIEPEPPRTEVGADRYTYFFPVGDAPPGQRATVLVQFEHDGPGRREVRLGVAGGEELAFRLFVYP